jgi:hypothetical protein
MGGLGGDGVLLAAEIQHAISLRSTQGVCMGGLGGDGVLLAAEIQHAISLRSTQGVCMGGLGGAFAACGDGQQILAAFAGPTTIETASKQNGSEDEPDGVVADGGGHNPILRTSRHGATTPLFSDEGFGGGDGGGMGFIRVKAYCLGI